MGSGRNILKVFALNVAIKTILAPISHEQVRETVIVVVASTHALSPTGRSQPERIRDVAEFIVPLVVVHPVCPPLAGEDEQVEQAVIVIIDESYAAARGLDDVLLRDNPAVR